MPGPHRSPSLRLVSPCLLLAAVPLAPERGHAAIVETCDTCLDLGVACLQVKDADPAYLAKAQAKCQKLSDKVQNQEKACW